MTTPPSNAGQAITAAALNAIIPQTAVLATDLASLGSTAAQAIVTVYTIPAGTYRFSGVLSYVADQSAGEAEISIHAAGPGTISSMAVNVKSYYADAALQEVSASQLTIGSGTFDSAVMVGSVMSVFEFDGIIVVSAAGNFSIDLAQTNSADTFVTQAGSYARIERVFGP